MELDERYEFDAPRFFNFSDNNEGDTRADDWFASAPDGPGVRKAGGCLCSLPQAPSNTVLLARVAHVRCTLRCRRRCSAGD